MSNPHSQKSTQKRKTVFLLAVLVAALVTPSSGVLSSVSVSQDLEKARGSKAHDSLQKYRDISALPMEKRRVAFSESSPQEKSDLFRIHLALHLANHPELSAAQKQVILEGIATATPERYELRPDDPKWKAQAQEFREFQNRASALFSRDEATRIFATVGEPEAPPGGVKSRDNALQKYIDIYALPMRSRKAEFRKTSPQGRSDLWRTHFSVQLAMRPELNESQKQVILEGMALATPELFESSLNNPDRKAQAALKQFEIRLRALFPGDEAAEIFAVLGGPEPAVSRSNPERPAASDRSKKVGISRATVQSSPTTQFTSQEIEVEGECNCSRADDYCAWGYKCDSSWCGRTDWGCGTLWVYECNGTCVRKS